MEIPRKSREEGKQHRTASQRNVGASDISNLKEETRMQSSKDQDRSFQYAQGRKHLGVPSSLSAVRQQAGEWICSLEDVIALE